MQQQGRGRITVVIQNDCWVGVHLFGIETPAILEARYRSFQFSRWRALAMAARTWFGAVPPTWSRAAAEPVRLSTS